MSVGEVLYLLEVTIPLSVEYDRERFMMVFLSIIAFLPRNMERNIGMNIQGQESDWSVRTAGDLRVWGLT